MTVTPPPAEPRNWFFTGVQIVGVVFIITALAYAVVPVLEDKLAESGVDVPPSPLPTALRKHGWIWLLVQVGLLAVLSFAAMAYDRWCQIRR